MNTNPNTVRIETSTLTWDKTGPFRWDAQSGDGAIWCYSAISGKTSEVTDLHEAGDDEHLSAHASATEAMDTLGSDD